MTQASYKKVLIINPPGKCHLRKDGTLGERKHCTPPLGLAYLAACLLKFDYEVEILDMLAEGYTQEVFQDPFIIYGLNEEQMMERIRKAKPDVIGISVLFSNRAKESYEIARRIKKEYPEVPIVLGGQHPSGLPREVMSHPEVDFVLVGEADLSFVHLLESLNGRHPREQVSGLYYREQGQVRDTLTHAKPAVQGDGWEYYNGKNFPTPKKLDELPLPAWHLFPMEAYWKSEVRIGGGDVIRERFAVMVSTRGCPHVCYFCTSPLMGGFKGYRMRTNEDVVKEIRWLVENWQVQEVQFLDDNFFVSAPRVKELCRVLAKEFPDLVFSVPAGTEINALDHEMIDLMAKANFHKLTLAVEAGTQEVQDGKIDKKVKLARIPEIVQYIRSRGMETRALYMIGFPDETRAQIQRTIDMALTLDVDDFYISLATPLPGTPLYDECVRRGLLYEDFDVNNLRYSVANIKLADINREELESLRKEIWLKAREIKYRQGKLKPEEIASMGAHREFRNTDDYENAGFTKKKPKDLRSAA